ncbi:phage holin [Amphibacillus sp. Q70]|uniref:phage holin n=1 Tax=Amphibacillus sp. Q70 TaxID=3453416 RepID=UPI003F84EFEB
MEKNKKIDKGVIIRTVALFVAFINQLLCFFGKSPIPIEEESLTTFISIIIMGVVSIWSWWKNNSFTKSAKEADEYKKIIKEGT